jgi:hypothetical protein
MRKPIELIEQDMTKPIQVEVDSECFGKEWNPTHSECAMCGMSDLCCIIFRKTTLTKKVQKIEREQQGFMDVEDFDINKDRLFELVTEEPTEYAEVFEMVSMKTGCKAAKTIHKWIEIFMFDYKLQNKDGILCKR